MYCSVRSLCILLDERLENTKLVTEFDYCTRRYHFGTLTGGSFILSCSVANPFTVGRRGGRLLKSELISPVFIQIQIL